MKHVFYDFKSKKKVEQEITKKVVYGEVNPHYAFITKTADGRTLTAFVTKAVYESAKENEK